MKYPELSQTAKDRALADHAGTLDYEWWECTFDDFVEVCKVMGVEVARDQHNAHDIVFSGFWSQGDGATFAGQIVLNSVAGAETRIRAYAPQDETLHGIAARLEQAVTLFQTTVSLIDTEDETDVPTMFITYSHRSHTQQLGEGDYAAIADNLVEELEELIATATEETNALSRWLYQTLETEYTYPTGEESLIDREEEFDESGVLLT